jgi:CRP-like cAMP-binding protein
MDVDITSLRQVPYFTRLTPVELVHVAEMTMAHCYERGDVIMLEGEQNGSLYFVHSGLVKVFKTSPTGREQMLHLIAAGQTFNDVPVFDGGPNPASAAAMERSIIYTIRAVGLRGLIATNPALAEVVVQVLARWLRNLVALIENVSLRSVTARVAKILLDQEAQEGEAIYALTQQEMASLAGTVREMVGRALKELELAGAIEMHQGRAIVVDRERLRLLTS